MATRSIKGVLARNSWDFYEYSTAWANVFAQNPATGSLVALLNPGTQQGNLDVYRAEFVLTTGQEFYWYAFQFPSPVPAQTGSPVNISACETNQPMPLGTVGYWSAAWFTGGNIIKVRLDKPSYDTIEVMSGGPFITLAPNWGFGVLLLGTLPASQQVSFTVWYQVILDQVSQVR